MALPALNTISLCTGGGGLDLGLGLAFPNARPVCLVEREGFAVAHLVAAMRDGFLHDAPVWSDARTFNGRPWRGVVDCVIGKIPCQSHSAAGKRRGREDERDLWDVMRRIIVQSGARWALVENVEGMLSTGGAARVVSDLQRLGFIVEGGLFTAREVGFTHRRARVFILGYLPGVGQAETSGARSQGQRADAAALGRQDARRLSGLRGGAIVEDPAHGDRGLHPRSRPAGPRAPDTGGAGEGSAVEHAESFGRGEGRPEPSLRGGGNAPSGSGGQGPVANTCGRHDLGRPDRPERGSQGRGADQRTGGADIPISPPGPGDIDAWRALLERAPELEPAVRRDADGVAGGMDLARHFDARTDRLRLLGNGVHPLAAAYAIRTLGARLARRGPECAAELAVMEGPLFAVAAE